MKLSIFLFLCIFLHNLYADNRFEACDAIELIDYKAECINQKCKRVHVFANIINTSNYKKNVFLDIFSFDFGWIRQKESVLISPGKTLKKKIVEIPKFLYGSIIRINSCFFDSTRSQQKSRSNKLQNYAEHLKKQQEVNKIIKRADKMREGRRQGKDMYRKTAVLYKQVLQINPFHEHALHYYAFSLFHSGQYYLWKRAINDLLYKYPNNEGGQEFREEGLAIIDEINYNNSKRRRY